MKKIYISTVTAFMILAFGTQTFAEPVVLPEKKPAAYSVKTSTAAPAVQYVSPVAIVDNPSLYLNKRVSFSGEFVSFTSLGLDYKPAFRDGSKFIGILMKRPDVPDHTIPLSELKMFMTRELAEKNIDIDSGDTFKLTGKVFSTALGDPWLDITEFKIVSKKNKQEDKK